MKYRIVHSTAYQYSDPVPVCHNQLRLSPRETAYTNCTSHRLLIRPSPSQVTRRKDWFGNPVQSFTLDESHRKLLLTATSRVTVSEQSLPDPASTPKCGDIAAGLPNESIEGWFDVIEFTFDSSLAARGETFRNYAADCLEPEQPILSATMSLMSKIHRDFKYDPKATTVVTRPDEALAQKHGVCQDFAHVAISCLRSFGVPARYVSGYLRTIPPPGKERLIGADASHAWFAVWCGEAGWIDLDPTNDKVCGTDHIPIAWGRDYSDVAPIRGVFTGGGNHTLNVSVDVEPIG